MSTLNIMNQDVMKSIFNHFDTKNRGYLLPDDIQSAFNRAGKSVTQSELKEIFEKHDINDDGVISFKEFTTIFRMF